MTSNTDDTKQLARGRWLDVLVAAGIDRQSLDGRGHPCPRCGGTDRFAAFRDAAETGGVICRRCFASGSDGIATVRWMLGCSYSEAVAFITRQLGTEQPKGQAFPSDEAAIISLKRSMQASGWRFTRAWAYHDVDEDLVALVARFDGPKGKTFRPVTRWPDGWRIGDPPGKWPLYGLSSDMGIPISADNVRNRTLNVFIVEGERCCDAVRSLGLPCVTSAHGSSSAAKSDWSAILDIGITISNFKAVILPDNDAPGRKYAKDVARILTGLGVTVQVLELPGLPEGGDVVDWIAQRQDRPPDALRDELTELVSTAEAFSEPDASEGPLRRPKLVRLSDVTPEAVNWLWPGRIALGKLTLFSGDPGLGKSFLSIDMAARVTTGKAWPDSPGVLNPIGSVVMLSAEDDLADTIRPRLDAAGADCSRVHALQAVRYRLEDSPDEHERAFNLASDVEVLEATLRDVSCCRLLVVDPITAYLGGTDSHRNAEIRAVLQPLSDLAARYGVAVVAVTHLNKSHGGPAIYRSMGSLAFTAAARAVWCVSKDQDNQQRRLVLPVKNNIAADASGLAYRIQGEPPRVEWEADPIGMTADDALAPPEEREERTERERARDWLRETLADGPVPSSDVLADAREHGLSEKTVRRAFRDLGGKPQKAGLKAGWSWSLPAEDGHEGSKMASL